MKSFTPPAKGTVNHDLEGDVAETSFYNRKITYDSAKIAWNSRGFF